MSDTFILPVQSFYEAFFQREKKDFKFGLFSYFPQNCCEFSSLLLALFLDQNFDFGSIQIIKGVNLKDEHDRHEWLCLEGIYIDITVRQYGNKLPKYLVSLEGYEGWHDRYEIRSKDYFNPEFYKNYREEGRKNILEDYSYLEKKALVILDDYRKGISELE